MSDDNAKPETDKKPEKTSEIPDAALDKATGGLKTVDELKVFEPYMEEEAIKPLWLIPLRPGPQNVGAAWAGSR